MTRKPSGASMLAFLLPFIALIGVALLVGPQRFGAWLGSWAATGGLGYLLALAVIVAALFGLLWLIRRR
jgi:uncharacterized membrane protein YbhN (UPF0104 family)